MARRVDGAESFLVGLRKKVVEMTGAPSVIIVFLGAAGPCPGNICVQSSLTVHGILLKHLFVLKKSQGSDHASVGIDLFLRRASAPIFFPSEKNLCPQCPFGQKICVPEGHLGVSKKLLNLY